MRGRRPPLGHCCCCPALPRGRAFGQLPPGGSSLPGHMWGPWGLHAPSRTASASRVGLGWPSLGAARRALRPAVPPERGALRRPLAGGPAEGPGEVGTRLTLYMLQSPGWLRACERRGLLPCVSQGTCQGTQSGRLSPCGHRGGAPSLPAMSRPERPGRAPGGGRETDRRWTARGAGRGDVGRRRRRLRRLRGRRTPGEEQEGGFRGPLAFGGPLLPEPALGPAPTGGHVCLQGWPQTRLPVTPAGGPPGPLGQPRPAASPGVSCSLWRP